jgi:hypothetical protein
VPSALRSKIESQSAGTPKVKAAKSKLVKGLEAIGLAYGALKAAFADKASRPEAAQAEATKALAAGEERAQTAHRSGEAAGLRPSVAPCGGVWVGPSHELEMESYLMLPFRVTSPPPISAPTLICPK